MKIHKKKHAIQESMMTILIMLMGASLVLIVGMGMFGSSAGGVETTSAATAAEGAELSTYTEHADNALLEITTETAAEGTEERESEKEEPQAKYDLTDEIKIPDTAFPFYVKVNRRQNCVTAYTLDEKGEYTIPVKAMVCSVGLRDNTPLGIFKTSDSYRWRELFGHVYGQYAYRIYNSIMFHSVPYFSPDKDNLETLEYNKLGQAASLGCVRLSVQDAKWIVDHCPRGTTVEIYEDDEPGPLGKPSAVTIDVASKNAGWDPTDPDRHNPWKNFAGVDSDDTEKEDTGEIGSEMGKNNRNDTTPPTIRFSHELVVDDSTLDDLSSYLQRSVIIRDNGKALDATHAVFDIYKMESGMRSAGYGTYTGKVYAVDEYGNRSKTVEFTVTYQPDETSGLK